MKKAPHRVLILGVSGMLGNAAFRFFSQSEGYETFGSARSGAVLQHFSPLLHSNIVTGVDVLDFDALTTLLNATTPHTIINCVGVVKQLATASDPLVAIPLNSILPHRLARLASLHGARVVHISTDCVFNGSKGNYTEADFADANDFYGRSKLLGEVDYPNAITLRTSIIGHEINSAQGLVGWFLSQKEPVKGYSSAIFSGLPTVELSRVIREFVLPRPELRGMYHVASKPIDKLTLLRLVKDRYERSTKIIPDGAVKIDRSLNAARFHAVTGYTSPDWPTLVSVMHEFG
jgi:dTDP-4-dehydrorhamnose reductase